MRHVVVLAYSGDLETSAALVWLREARGAEVVTVTLDFGQGGDLAAAQRRALALGATRAHVRDVRGEFARECVLPALQSGVLHDAARPIGRIGHPLMARMLVETAAAECAAAVAHGGDAADHDSIAAAVASLRADLDVIPALGAAGLDGESLTTFVRERNIAVPDARPRATRTSRRGVIDVPAHVDVRFEDGVPTAVNDVDMPLPELIESVATIAAHHGITGGPRSAPDSEASAGVVLGKAYDALVTAAAGPATGVVRLRLFKGEHVIVGHSPVAA